MYFFNEPTRNETAVTQQPDHDNATSSTEDPPADLLDGGPVDDTPSYTELDVDVDAAKDEDSSDS